MFVYGKLNNVTSAHDVNHPKNVLEAGKNINHVTDEGFGEGRSDGLGHGMSENIIKCCQNTQRVMT